MSNQTAAAVAARLRKLEIVNAASLRAVRRELSAQMASAPPKDVIALALGIIEQRAPGAYPVAYELILYHPAALATLRVSHLQRMGKHMCGWGDVDCFSGLAGVAWRNHQISDAVIHRWARSRNRWWRRAALVSTVPLNMKSQGGTGDAKRTLAVCRLLLRDRDDMVVKAMSWALRALATREPHRVGEFVDKYEDALPRRAVREVRNKLRTGRKDGRVVRGK
jgi:3-methyladenine DNA glycosylase AlkD